MCILSKDYISPELFSTFCGIFVWDCLIFGQYALSQAINQATRSVGSRVLDNQPNHCRVARQHCAWLPAGSTTNRGSRSARQQVVTSRQPIVVAELLGNHACYRASSASIQPSYSTATIGCRASSAVKL
ncbi:hypothetical protein Fot_03042 [Forsythia ovata]|uniref:Uncharacterized protein n=1 Tax=Forsythia ovata TaxID=205694 RepID=A0ABD1XBN6_9LAMI